MTFTLSGFANSYVNEKSTLAKGKGAFFIWAVLTVKAHSELSPHTSLNQSSLEAFLPVSLENRLTESGTKSTRAAR